MTYKELPIFYDFWNHFVKSIWRSRALVTYSESAGNFPDVHKPGSMKVLRFDGPESSKLAHSVGHEKSCDDVKGFHDDFLNQRSCL